MTPKLAAAVAKLQGGDTLSLVYLPPPADGISAHESGAGS